MPLTKISPNNLHQTVSTMVSTMVSENAVDSAAVVLLVDSSFNELIGGQGLTYTANTKTFDITNSGVTAGSYGSASLVPVLTLNAKGQVTSASTVSVAGVSSAAFDSASGIFTINTADGGSFPTHIVSADSDFVKTVQFASLTVNDSATVGGMLVKGHIKPDVTEVYDLGDSDKRFKDLYLSGSTLNMAGTSIQVDASGDIEIKDKQNTFKRIKAKEVELNDSAGDTFKTVLKKSSGRVAFVKVRKSDGAELSDSDADPLNFLANTTKDLKESGNLYYTNARADARIAAASTSNLSEGTNLYFTNERVDDRVGALIVGGNNITATYNDAAGTLTIDGQPGYADSDVASYLGTNGYGTSSSIIGSITASAPSTLDTLNELAAALGDDANFSTTVTNSIASKLPLAGGTMTGQLVIADNDGGQSMLQVRNYATSATGGFTNAYTAEIRGATSGGQSHGMLINLNEANDSRRTLDIGDNNGVFASFVNGKVGLGGQTNPQAKLDIKGDTQTYAGMSKIYLTDTSSSVARRNWAIGNGGSAFGNFTIGLSNAADGDPMASGTHTTPFIINNSGNSFFSGDVQAAGLYVGATNTSYDFYNNGTSYLNGATTIDANLTVNGVTFKSGSNLTRNLKIQPTGSEDSVGLSMYTPSGSHSIQLYGNATEYGFLDANWGGWDIQKTKNGALKVDEGSGLQRVFNDGYHPNADAWTTARTLSLSGDASGSVSWDGSGNASLSVAVSNDSHTHNKIISTDDRDMKPSTSGITSGVQALRPFFSSFGGMTGTANTTYLDVLAFDTYSDSSGGGPSAITFHKGASNGSPVMYIWKAGFGATTWSTGQRVFADNYHPNADAWTTSRTITLAGDATGSVSLDGSADVTLTMQVADDSHLHDSRYIQDGGTDFGGTYPLYFRTAARQAYSNGGITYTGSTDTLNVSGTLDVLGNIDTRTQNNTTHTNTLYFGINNGNSAGTSNEIGSGITWKPDHSGYTKRSAGILQIGEGNYFRSGLAFYTNNTADSSTDWSERMRISKEGNVGINIAEPDAKLHVNGAAIIGSSNNIGTTPIAGLHILDQAYSTWNPTLSKNQVALRVETYWKGSNNHDRAIGDYGGGIGFNHLGGHSTSHDENVHAWIGPRVWDTPGHERSALVFATNNVTTDEDAGIFERMCITPAGNVGIGNGAANPSNKLHIISTTATDGILIQGNQTGGPALQIQSTAASGKHLGLISNNTNNTDGAGLLQFWNFTDSHTFASWGTTSGSQSRVYTNLAAMGDTTNATLTGPGQLALKRANDNPYLSFHNNAGARTGYLQSLSSTDTLGFYEHATYTFDSLGNSTTVEIRSKDAGLAILKVGNSTNGTQATGAVEVSQDGLHGGGFYYNGDGTPSFASGETEDTIGFYRISAGTRTEVFSYPYSSNHVTFNGNITLSGTVDGVDISARDAVLTTTTNTANAALPKAGGTASGDITFSGGAGAISVGAGSDIRFTTGAWTGEHVGKIQYHSNSMYFQANNTWYFRNSAGANNVSISSGGNITLAGTLDVDGFKLQEGSNSNNFKIKTSTTGASGISLYNSSDEWRAQLYGEGTNYGFLASNWGSWDIRKTVSGKLYLNNTTTYYLQPESTSAFNVITAASTVTASYFTATSDLKLKTNIKSIDSPIAKVNQLNGYSFEWKDTGKSSLGVVAQEVEKVIPSAVSENEEGIKSVNYNEIIGVLIEAVKEQQTQIDELKSKLGNL